MSGDDQMERAERIMALERGLRLLESEQRLRIAEARSQAFHLVQLIDSLVRQQGGPELHRARQMATTLFEHLGAGLQDGEKEKEESQGEFEEGEPG